MSKKVLFAVLNWGLGHASRSACIINELIRQEIEVVLASDGIALEYLVDQFPRLKAYSLPHLNIKYPSKSLLLNMSYQWPILIRNNQQEHTAINHIIKAESPSLIISDNRYGCYSKQVHSVFITHQLNLPIANKVLRWLANKFIKTMIQQYDECWIPDYPSTLLSGKLSQQKLTIPIKYIGPISHFANMDVRKIEYERDLLIILSGPEPQRTKLETLLIKQLNELTYSVLIVQGIPNIKNPSSISNHRVKVVPYLGAKDLHEEILISSQIICRSGYSSIMDLAIIGRSALLIPTPGQTEQEYLADLVFNNGIHHCVAQNKLIIKRDIKLIPKIQSIEVDYNKLSSFIDQNLKNWRTSGFID